MHLLRRYNFKNIRCIFRREKEGERKKKKLCDGAIVMISLDINAENEYVSIMSYANFGHQSSIKFIEYT